MDFKYLLEVGIINMLQINSNQTIRFQLQFLILLIFTISDLEIRINEVGSFLQVHIIVLSI